MIKQGERRMFTKHLTEKEDGIFIREAKSDDVETHCRDNALRALKDDQYHYQCMARRFADSPVFSKEFYSVAAVGGGHPKLASHMNLSGDVTVYDQYAEMYEDTHDEFSKLYPIEAPVKYEKKTITHANFTPNAEVAVISHVLEHLKIKQIRRLLSNLETDKVIIYGPNVAKARNEKWFHFTPRDHRTFATLGAMGKLVEEAGFKVVWAVQYREDYMIYGEK